MKIEINFKLFGKTNLNAPSTERVAYSLFLWEPEHSQHAYGVDAACDMLHEVTTRTGLYYMIITTEYVTLQPRTLLSHRRANQMRTERGRKVQRVNRELM
jgi:hypothetical protein